MTAQVEAEVILAELVRELLGELASKPLATVDEAAELLGQGRTSTFDAIRRGDLPSVKWGRRTLVPVPALARWLLGADPPLNGSDPAVTGEVAGELHGRADQGAHDGG